jgi:hypothetical protein
MCCVVCVGGDSVKSVYTLPEGGTDMLKPVQVVKSHTFMCVCDLFIEFVLQMNIKLLGVVMLNS